MVTIPMDVQHEIIVLFKKDNTVREISELLGYDKQDILFFLTKKGYWSDNCSGCTIKRCYDCMGLEELGRPVSVQDRINFIARVKNDTKRT